MGSTSSTMVAATLALAVASTLASAQTPKVSDGVVRIGVLTDMAGPFSDISGPGAVLAIKMAVEDFGGKVLGKPIEVVAADHQNKPDIGVSKAREWIDVDHVVPCVPGHRATFGRGADELALERELSRDMLGCGGNRPAFIPADRTPLFVGTRLDARSELPERLIELVRERR